MDVRVGTSGFSYPEWKGSFYPADMKPAGMLSFYAQRFGTVEINNTFYRMPKPETVTAWAAAVPESFRFVLKAPNWVTNRKTLDGIELLVESFLRAREPLGAKVGPTLFQFAPHLKKDLSRLEAFLAALPSGTRPVLEFGEPSWFSDDVLSLLQSRQAALCIVDDAERAAPFASTAAHGYVRLRRKGYSKPDLARWAKRILATPWESAWVFFKHEDEGTGPRFATELVRQLA